MRESPPRSDEDVGEQAADEAVEDDRLREREAEPLDARQLAAELWLASDRLDHRAEDVADADAGAQGTEAHSERERYGLSSIAAVRGGGKERCDDVHGVLPP